jgi:hypothetical protein
LIGTCHGLYLAIAVVAIDDAMEDLSGEEVHELSEQRLANVHGSLRKKKPEDCQNRLSTFKSETPFIARDPASVMAFSDSLLHLTGHY